MRKPVIELFPAPRLSIISLVVFALSLAMPQAQAQVQVQSGADVGTQVGRSSPVVLTEKYNCPADPSASVTQSQVIGQVIELNYHRWVETRSISADGRVSVCLEQQVPAKGYLDRAQAEALLKASGDWQRQYSAVKGPYGAAASAPETSGQTQADDPRLLAEPRRIPRLDPGRAPGDAAGNLTNPQDASKTLAPLDNPAQAPAKRQSAPITQSQASPGPNPSIGVEMAENYSAVSNTQVFPWNSFGFLTLTAPDSKRYRCTGFLVAPKTLITAGHCVYDNQVGQTGWMTGFQFSPGQYVDSTGRVMTPYGTIAGAMAKTNSNWIAAVATTNKDPNVGADYGAVILANSVPTITTFMPISYGTNLNSQTGCINYAGYPGTVGGVTNYALQTGCQSVNRDYGSYTIIDTTVVGGNSGGPAWLFNTSTSTRLLQGIVTAGDDTSTALTRFTTANQSLIESWIASGADSTPSNISLSAPASASPTSLSAGGTTNLSVGATYAVAGGTLTYGWSATCPGSNPTGSFSAAGAAKTTWTAPNVTGSNISCTLMVTITGSAGGQVSSTIAVSVAANTSITPQTGWWWSSTEPGRGYSIEVEDGKIFMAAYMYRTTGQPVWYIATGPFANSSFSGGLVEYSGTQTLNSGPPANAAAIPTSTNIMVRFTSPTSGTIQWQAGPFATPITTNISRYSFSGSTLLAAPAGAPQTGWWWNPAEGGTGYFIEQQGSQIFMAAYLYGANNQDIWYYGLGSPATGPFGSTTSTMSTPLVQASGGQVLGSQVVQSPTTSVVGNVSLQISTPTTATLTLPSGRQVSLRRFISY